MKKTILTLLLFTSLSGCAAQYGNYANLTDENSEVMAIDTVDKLTKIYPPAATHFVLLQPSKDTYGTYLVQELRQNGYAVNDNDSVSDLLGSLFTASVPDSDPADLSPIVIEPVTPESSEKALGYIVDQVKDNLYRVTINVSPSVLSRVYAVSKNNAVPAGAWTRKE